ncbi:hypothetical protein BDR07DRAFT_1492579 [Suillus spraguei]|nr:hypothetical protein BDR07DRAFT_1492579 [Suillus spraguei]
MGPPISVGDDIPLAHPSTSEIMFPRSTRLSRKYKSPGPPVSIGNNIPPGPSVNIEDIHNLGPSLTGYYVGRVTRIVRKNFTQVPFNFVSLLLPPPSQTQCLSLWILPCPSWWSLPGLSPFMVAPPWPFEFPHGSPLALHGWIFSWFLPGPLWWFLPGLSSRFLPGPSWWSLFGVSSQFLADSSSWSHPGSSFWPFTLHYLSVSVLYIM